MPLDRSKPYAEVSGLPGASYEQNGILFTSDGMPSLHLNPYTEDAPEFDSGEPLPAVTCIEMPSVAEDITNGDALENLHWRKLKLLVESYGGTFTTRLEAIKFIKSGDK